MSKHKTVKTKEQKAVQLARLNAWVDKNKEYAKKKTKEWKNKNRWRESVKRTERKQRVINAYGGKCSWKDCGLTDVDVLTVDHVDNNGAAERKEIGHVTGDKMVRRLIRLNFPGGYQILCSNHQLKKQILKYRDEVFIRSGLNAQS